jgi:hypothetical protein
MAILMSERALEYKQVPPPPGTLLKIVVVSANASVRRLAWTSSLYGDQ